MKTSRRAMFGLLVGLLAVGAVACGDDAAAPTDTAAVITVADLQGKTYVATDATGIVLPPTSNLTIAFLVTNLSVSGGCNTMTGAWQIMSGNHLLVSQLASTQKACADDLMTLDNSVTQVLNSQPVVALDGDKMSLTEGSIVLNFKQST
jgi:heat shock protein HslJ